MKTGSPYLFDLIKSLTTQEKVYFKIYSRRKLKGNYYTELFDNINRLKVYDEAILRKKIKNKHILKNLKAFKSYTIETILKSLEEYYSTSTVSAILRSSISHIEILINKRLFALAKKRIAKAQELALKNCEYYYLIILFSLQLEVIDGETNRKEMEAYGEGLYLKEVEYIKYITNIIAYRKLHSKASAFMIHKFSYGKDNHSITRLLNDSLLKNYNNAFSLPSKIRFHRTLWILNSISENWQEALFHIQKAIELLEQNPFYLRNKIGFYTTLNGNLFSVLTSLNRTKECSIVYNNVARLISSLPKKILASTQVYRGYISMTNNYTYNLIGIYDFEAALKISDGLKNLVKKYDTIGPFRQFCFLRCVILFYLKRYRDALRQVNEILSFEDNGVRRDITNTSIILNIIIHFELGNNELLPRLYKKAHQYFKQKKELGSYENQILTFLEEVIPKISVSRKKFISFYDFEKTFDSVVTSHASGGFDFKLWLRSKIEKRALKDLLAEKKIT